MLGKLIKHEWKATWKIIVLINLFLIALTVLGMISFASNLWSIDDILIEVLAISSLLIYYFTIIGITFAVMIYLYVHFYKNLYTGEGYLMHTLPVTPRQLVFSKVILGSCYVMITFFNIIISVFALLFTLAEGFSFSEMVAAFYTEIIPAFNSEFGMNFSTFILIAIIGFILSCISGILMGFASVSLGQLFTKHKVLGAFVSYFGLQMARQIMSMFIMIPAMTVAFGSNNPSSYFKPMLFGTLILTAILDIVLYFITELIMSKKLNLD